MSRTDVIIEPGMIYEDCAFHPVLCTNVYDDDSIGGISLIDGSYPRNCSLYHCDVKKLSIDEALVIHKNFNAHVARRKSEIAAEVAQREAMSHQDGESQ